MLLKLCFPRDFLMHQAGLPQMGSNRNLSLVWNRTMRTYFLWINPPPPLSKNCNNIYSIFFFAKFLSQLGTLGAIQLLTLTLNEPFMLEAVHLYLFLVMKRFLTEYSLEAAACKTSLPVMTFGKPVCFGFFLFNYRYLHSPWTDEC